MGPRGWQARRRHGRSTPLRAAWIGRAMRVYLALESIPGTSRKMCTPSARTRRTGRGRRGVVLRRRTVLLSWSLKGTSNHVPGAVQRLWLGAPALGFVLNAGLVVFGNKASLASTRLETHGRTRGILKYLLSVASKSPFLRVA